MAGHSKWANIKHRKAAQDAKKGKVFTKLIRELTVAARSGGPEPADNPRLRAAIDKALSENMTRDTIDRAIKRGAGVDDGKPMDEVTYEGYAPGGVAVLVQTMTDNINRTVGDVRHAFSKHGGNLGTAGSVAYLFEQRGEILLPPGLDEDALMEVALEAGASDVLQEEDGSFTIVTAADNSFGVVVDALRQADLEVANAEVVMAPANHIEVEGEIAEKVLKLIDQLEDLDDVQAVFSNADFIDPLA